MDRIVAAAEATLRRHPAPGPPQPRLVELLRREGPDPWVDAARLRPLLEACPDRFRVLDLWQGSLRSLQALAGGTEFQGDAWVAVITDPAGRGPDRANRASATLRESVRWLARGVDGRSTREVARWQRVLREEAAVRPFLDRSA